MASINPPSNASQEAAAPPSELVTDDRYQPGSMHVEQSTTSDGRMLLYFTFPDPVPPALDFHPVDPGDESGPSGAAPSLPAI